MTECSKVAQEIDFKFYPDHETALTGTGYVVAVVEVEGMNPPPTVIKTVINDKNKIMPIGEKMALTGVDNLASARFQLVKINYNIPVKPYGISEDVYIFESLL